MESRARQTAASSPNRNDGRVDEVIAAYLAAAEAGERPDPTDWLRRYPELTANLAEFFADQRAVESFTQPFRPCIAGAEDGSLARIGSVPEGPATGRRQIGDYELLEEIARGGMGVVYRARQRSLDRIVALKMIRAGELASAEDRRRFEVEAAAAASLDHTHIVPIYEVGEHEGRPYFSMKLIEGGSLASHGSSFQLDPAGTARLVATTARALHHAHQRGILHRDLKPANILLDERRLPYITDFGLAKRLPTDSCPRGLHVTDSHAILGTVHYLSPEQADGQVRRLTTAADVWGLGAIFYELLTGRPPFEGESALEVLSKVRDEAPRPPRVTNPRISTDLETICLKCLRKEPSQRYGSAEALAEDLERWVRGEPIHARPTPPVERLWRWCRRNPVVSTLTGVVLAMLVVGAAGATVAALRLDELAKQATHAAVAADRRRQDAEHERANTQAALARAEAERDAKEKALRRADGLRLTAHATAALLTDPALSLLLAIEGAQRAPCQLSNNALLAALEACREESTFNLADRREFTTARFSTDGRRILACDGSGTIVAWDRVSRGPIAERRERWQRNFTSFGSAVFSPDGQSYAVAYRDTASADHCGIDPERKRTVKYYTDRVVRVGDLATGRITAFLKGHEARVVSHEFSSDGTRLLTASYDGTARVWDAETGRPLQVLQGSTTALSTARFSPDGRRVLTLTSPYDHREWRYPSEAPGNVVDPPEIEDPYDPAVVTRLGPACSVGTGGWGSGGASLDESGDYARVFDTATGKQLAALQPSALVRAYAGCRFPTWGAFSPDGDLVVTLAAGFSYGLIWEAATGKVRVRLRDGERRLGSQALFNPDGTRVATVLMSDDDDVTRSHVRIWDVQTGKEVAHTDAHGQVIHGLAFSPDGRLLATAADDGTARLWDVATGRELAQLRGHGRPVRSVAFSPDGQRLVTAGEDGTVRVWRTHAQERHVLRLQANREGEGPGTPLRTITFSPDGRQLVTTADEAAVRLWDAGTGMPTNVLRGQTGQPDLSERDREEVLGHALDARFSRDSSRVLVLRRMDKVTIMRGADERSLPIPFTPARLFDRGGNELAGYLAEDWQVRQARWSPDERLVLTVEEQRMNWKTLGANGSWGGGGGSAEGVTVARVYEAATGHERMVLRDPPFQVPEHAGPDGQSVMVTRQMSITAAAFAPDGKRVVTVANERGRANWSLRIWDVATGRVLRTLYCGSDGLGDHVCWSPDGQRLLTDCRGDHAFLWDAASGKRITELPVSLRADLDAYSDRDRVFFTDCPFSCDGSRLAGISPGHALVIVDASTGKVVTVGKGHRRPIRCIAFNSDGNRVATASDDGTARIWDARTGEEIVAFSGHSGPVLHVAFNAASDRLATTGADGTGRIWQLDLAAVARSSSPRELTPEERARYDVGEWGSK